MASIDSFQTLLEGHRTILELSFLFLFLFPILVDFWSSEGLLSILIFQKWNYMLFSRSKTISQDTVICFPWIHVVCAVGGWLYNHVLLEVTNYIEPSLTFSRHAELIIWMTWMSLIPLKYADIHNTMKWTFFIISHPILKLQILYSEKWHAKIITKVLRTFHGH